MTNKIRMSSVRQDERKELARDRPRNGMNRRKHKRINIEHPAIVLHQSHTHTRCQILNFSKGGLFLKSQEDGFGDIPDEKSQRLATLEIPMQGRRETPVLTIQVRIAHVSPAGLGVAFTYEQGALLDYLTEQHKRQAEQLKRQRAAVPGQMRPLGDPGYIVKEIQSRVEEYIRSRFADFYKQAKEALFEAADHAMQNRQQADLFYALTALDKNHENTQRACLTITQRKIAELFDTRRRRVEVSHQPRAEYKMDLVDKEDFDEWVAVVSVARSSESQVYTALTRLEKAFTFLARRPITNESNPLSPFSQIWTLKQATDHLGMEPDAKRIIYLTYRDTLLGEIALLYDELSEFLAEQGVIAAEELDKNAIPMQGSAKPGTRKKRKKGMIETLSSLMTFGEEEDEEEAPSAQELASQSAILKSLEGISRSEGGSLIPRIQAQLATQRGTPTAIDAGTRCIIDSTQNLVSALRQDQRLSGNMRKLVGSLEVGLIREAIKDPNLLNDKEHPGKKLFEVIDRLIPFCQPTELKNREQTSLFAALDEIGRSAVEDGAADLSQISRQIEDLLAKQEQLFDRNLSTLVESLEHAEKLQKGRKKVLDFLKKRLTGESVSVAVARLLKLGWLGLLIDVAVEKGAKSPDWQRYLGVIDFLLVALKQGRVPSPIEGSRLEEFLDALKSGFTAFPVHAESAALFVEEMQQIFSQGGASYQAMLEERVVLDDKALDQLFQQLFPDQPVTAGRQAQGAAGAQWSSALQALSVDEWIVEQRNQGEVRLLNLAWKSPDSSRFVFVDGSGTKALDTDIHSLAEQFEQHRYSLLENKELPLVERTVNRVLKRTFDKIKQDSKKDELTGLMNRKAFEHEMGALIKIAVSEGSHHALILLDIDKFNMVNEICGFDGGDKLLQTIATIVRTYVQDDALIARTGDDEFGLLVKNCTAEKGFQIAESQRRALDNLKYNWNGMSVPVSASVGMVALDNSGSTPEELLKHAASACALAKEAGRNCTRVYQSDQSVFEQQRRLVHSVPFIEQAIENDQICLYAQLITPLFVGEGEKDHFEILLRILDDKGEPKPPGQFIQAAEQFDRMRSVDRWVVTTFFNWVNQQQEQTSEIGGFTINLSGQSLIDRELGEFIKEQIRQSPIPPGKIGFEITETVMMKEVGKAKQLIEEIKQAGCSFYLDDFGSGYSSYSYLKELPVDYVKIDGIFVEDILEDQTSRAMVKSITEIAHHMGKKVIAEFVESEAIMIALRKLDVDFGQGYGIGRPFPLKQIFS